MATIPRGEAWGIDWRLVKTNQRTGLPEPLVETTAVSWWLSATFKGEPITEASVVVLTRGHQDPREDGREHWFGVLDSGDVTDALADIATSGSVYEVVEVSVTQADGEVVPERKSRVLTVVD